jgi:hypothetical protein
VEIDFYIFFHLTLKDTRVLNEIVTDFSVAKFFASELQRIFFTVHHIYHLIVYINRRKTNY